MPNIREFDRYLVGRERVSEFVKSLSVDGEVGYIFREGRITSES